MDPLNPSEETNNTEKPADIFVERDVLGLEKSKTPGAPTNAHPARIFIILAIVVVIVLAYWMMNRG